MADLEQAALKLLNPEQIGWGALIVFVVVIMMTILHRTLPENFFETPSGRVLNGVFPLAGGVAGSALVRLAGGFPPLLWILFGLVIGAAAWLVYEHRAIFALWLERRYQAKVARLKAKKEGASETVETPSK